MSEAMHAELTALLEAYLSNNKVRKTVIITIHGETNAVDIQEITPLQALIEKLEE
jgi:hypothetical protein